MKLRIFLFLLLSIFFLFSVGGGLYVAGILKISIHKNEPLAYQDAMASFETVQVSKEVSGSARILGEQSVSEKNPAHITSAVSNKQETTAVQEKTNSQTQSPEQYTQYDTEALIKVYNDAYNQALKQYPPVTLSVGGFDGTPTPTPYVPPPTTAPSGPSEAYCASQRSYYESQYNSQVSSENNRYNQEVNAIQSNAASNGVYGGGGSKRLEGSATATHNSYLDYYKANYDANMSYLSSVGC